MPPKITKAKSTLSPGIKKKNASLPKAPGRKTVNSATRAKIALQKKSALEAQKLQKALVEKDHYDSALKSLLTSIRVQTEATFPTISEESKAVIAAGILDSVGEEMFEIELQVARMGGGRTPLSTSETSTPPLPAPETDPALIG